MKSKIFAGILLTFTVVVGFFLPSIVSYMQDCVQGQRQEHYALPLVKVSVDQNTHGSSVDKATVFERLALFQNSVQYLSLETKVDEAAVEPLAARVAAYLRDAGIIGDISFDTVSIVTQMAISSTRPEQAMTLWMYSGRTPNDDELTIVFDSQTGLAMRIDLHRQSNSGTVNVEDEWSKWQEFFQSYYQLPGADTVVVTKSSDSQRTFIFTSQSDGDDAEQIELALPIKIIQLVESDGQGERKLILYQFNRSLNLVKLG